MVLDFAPSFAHRWPECRQTLRLVVREWSSDAIKLFVGVESTSDLLNVREIVLNVAEYCPSVCLEHFRRVERLTLSSSKHKASWGCVLDWDRDFVLGPLREVRTLGLDGMDLSPERAGLLRDKLTGSSVCRVEIRESTGVPEDVLDVLRGCFEVVNWDGKNGRSFAANAGV